MDNEKLSELITLYEFEPDVRDIYVEGATDARVVREFCRVENLSVVVKEIDFVDFPDTLTELHSGEVGNCGRVFALSVELSKKIKDVNTQVACIIDADLDLFLKRRKANDVLLMTDFVCMEMYVYDRINHFFSFYPHNFPDDRDDILRSLEEVVTNLFCFRLADAQLGWKLAWPNRINSFVTASEGHCELNEGSFLLQYLGQGGKFSEKETFIAAAKSFSSKLPHDCRMKMNGHDFIDVISILCKPYISDSFLRGPKAIGRSLWVSIRVDKLKDFPLFKTLIDRFG